ncbi:UPF0641 membrane protein [Neolecta irregularis DAH-3]|uniref:UPF0641 membrane protein n=1 Tax=Neolecta irregularis (strain DAH-3) TaxID=1198029 RepID=A0A1U7LJB3_NEOID|nr:UPF0641 membrane protein [Neolecta irregularis DAH-3]|eukprot:OLL22756.1 UPF0641 membrane protein [Neolecta irregularis DAH-3]
MTTPALLADPINPLQRFNSPSRSWSLLLHTLGLTSFLSTFASCYLYPTVHPNYTSHSDIQFLNDSFGGHFQFLTIIGLVAAAVGFTAALLADISGSFQLFKIKNYISIISTPLACLVSLLYWTIIAVNKEMMLPPEIIEKMTPTRDFGLHLSPLIFLTIDFLLFSPPWAINTKTAFYIHFSLGQGYFRWIQYCQKQNGWWAYPFLENMTMMQRKVFIVASTFISWLIFVGFRALYDSINRNNLKSPIEGASPKETKKRK